MKQERFYKTNEAKIYLQKWIKKDFDQMNKAKIFLFENGHFAYDRPKMSFKFLIWIPRVAQKNKTKIHSG